MKIEAGGLNKVHCQAAGRSGASVSRRKLSSLAKLGARVAHEVRNPPNAISMAAQRLQREFAPPVFGISAVCTYLLLQDKGQWIYAINRIPPDKITM
jgi:signal transduction histidine kinase